MADIKKILGEVLEKAKKAKAEEESDRQKRNDEDRTKVLTGIGADVSKSLQSALPELMKSAQMSEETIKNALREAIQVNMPEMKIPDINIPDIHIDTSEFSAIASRIERAISSLNLKEPVVNVQSQTDFPDKFNVSLPDYDKLRPMPVMMMDDKGRPLSLSQGTSGGKADFLTIKDIRTSTGASIISDPENAIRITGTVSVASSNSSTQAIDSSGNVYSQANPLPVIFSATASTASALIDSGGVQYSGSNPLPVTFSASASQAVTVVNVVSALNSSTAVLANGAVFTALAEDVTNYASITVSVFADQISATDGLSIQQSSDGSNWDMTDVYSIPASTGKTFSVQPISRYFRVVYTNGTTLQGSFRLSTVLHAVSSQPSSQRSSDAYTNETDLQQFWGFLSAYNGSTWDRLRNTAGEGNALRVQNANDAINSVNVRDVFATTVTSVVVNPDNRVRVELPITTISSITSTIASNIVDSSGVSYSGSNPLPITGPVVVSSITATIATSNVDSSGVQYSGSNPFPFTIVTSATATVNTALTDSGGVQYSGSNPVPITVAVSNATSTINAVIVDSSGIGYNGTNPMPVSATLSGSLTSTVVVGDIPAGTADTGSAPVKIGGIARQTNPTAEADGERLSVTLDDIGRLITRPVQVRDLIKTAYASVTTGSETTLITAVAGAYLDLIMVVASNNSDAAISVDIRPVTNGNIVNTLRVPANGTAGFTPSVPWPQTDTGNNWTVDLPDVTGSTLTFSALFSQEV